MRSFCISIVVISLFFALLAPAGAVGTRAIEAVRAKKVLDDADLQTIDAFVAQAVGEILVTDDFSSISGIRSIILANSASSQPGQLQFTEQFSESSKKHIAAALQTADGLTPPDRSFKVITNLLMLLDDLSDLRLVDLPLKYVDSENRVVSYWAVSCLTNPKIIEGLNSSKEPDVARGICRRLGEAVATGGPRTLGLIGAFAGSVTISAGEDLLLEVADRRIASYADWSVQYELLDGTILQLLCDKMGSSDPGRAAAAQRFGQLFSYVFQRYLKGDNLLSAAQKQQLVSVLIETEKSCLSRFTGRPSFDIKKAIESSDRDALLREHNNLLGGAARPGQLVTEINFDYGKAADGSPLKAPLPLPDAPKS